SRPAALEEMVEGGACSLKLHEDWGTTPAAIDCCLAIADDYDIQVMIHTDTLNESGVVEDPIKAFKGRTIHALHSDGAGRGHAAQRAPVAGMPPTSSSSRASRTCCRRPPIRPGRSPGTPSTSISTC